MSDAVRKAFLDALAVGESGGAYDVLFGGARFTDFSAFPSWSGLQGPAGVSHAAGRYQFEPATWREEAGRLGLPDFSPASQDEAAWDLAQRVYATRTGSDLETDLEAGDTSQVQSALQSTWTSLDSRFPQRYRAALAAATGAGAQRKPVVSAPAPAAPAVAQPAPQPFILPTAHVGTMASAGVAYALVVTIVWLLGLNGVTVPEVVQDGWVVLATAAGGWFLHTPLGRLAEGDVK